MYGPSWGRKPVAYFLSSLYWHACFFIFVFWRDLLEGGEEAILSFEAYEFVCDLESLLQALENGKVRG